MNKTTQIPTNLHPNAEVLRTARTTINGVADGIVFRQSQLLLDVIEEAFVLPNFIQGVLPPLQAFLTEEGTLLLEWIMPNCRLGFSIDPIPEESSWYLITDVTLGAIAASGFLQKATLKPLVRWLLSFLALPLQPA